MGFLDKARSAANDLAAKADTALAGSGLGGPGAAGGDDADRYFRDLGVLTYLEASGRPGSPEERRRVMTTLEEMDAKGAIRSFSLQTAPPPAPGGSTSHGQVPPPPPGATASGGGPGQAPPPPRPSWASGADETPGESTGTR